MSRTDGIGRGLAAIFTELVHGAPTTGPAHVLNRGDAGALASLDRISAAQASAPRAGGASIAAHVDHLRYGLWLMNRWAAGEDPFRDANWSRSWEITTVGDAEWTSLRDALRVEADRWLVNLRASREASDTEIDDMIGSVAHLAYHLGAIRQIDRALRGPPAND